MAIKIKFDNENRAILPTLVLATRSGHKLGCIPAQHIVLHGSMTNGYELSCTVSKYDNWEKAELWDELEDFKLLWSPEWDVWFEIDVTTSETDETTKNIAAVSVGEAELSQVMLYNIEINTETDIARSDYKPTTIYNSEDPSASLLDRIMEKTPHYSIRHVDASIAKLQRTFSFDSKSLRDALLEICKEVNALLIIHSGTDADGKIERAYSIYDLEEHCPDCGYRGKRESGVCPECGKTEWSFGYGEDTGIFVSRENLADNITYETEKDSVKNCFRLVAGDDLMTAAVASVNPNGTNYLWYISDKVRKDMSSALRTRLNQYDELYQSAQDNTYSLGSPAIDSYNMLAEKYGKEQINDAEKFPGLLDAYYDTIDFKLYLEHDLLPDVEPPVTSASDELRKLLANISPVSVRSLTTLSSTTATSYVVQAARTIIDPRYSVTTKDETLNGNIWSGSFIITRYSDEEDTVTSKNVSVTINEDYENYIRRQIDRVLNTSEFEDLDIVALFEKSDAGFISEIKKYSLAMLKSFYDACQACLNVLVEHNAANESTWADIYNDLYTPYYSKFGYLQTEITVRESEIATIEKAQSEIGAIITSVQESLDFEKFMGEELWLEFAAYRREDTYQNDNYISDGLDNAALVKNAREFVDTAQEEIERSATLQHSISSTLGNLLVMEEFKELTDKFETGNWIRIKVDDKVYILRLIDYEIDFDNPDSLEVEYSDVVSSSGCINDIKSILDSANSMSTSYGSVSRQAKHGDNSNRELNSWVTDGLEVTKVRFMSDAEEQNITWGENGMLFRKWDEVAQAYEPTQLRIINSTIAVTDDNWKTVKTAVGGFDYKDPVSGEIKHGYGINAELLIGKLILGENLGLYNEANSLTFDSNGLNVSNNVNSFTVSPNGDTLLSLKKGKDNIFWVDKDGGLHLSPTEFTLTTGKDLEGVLSDLDKATKDAQNLQVILSNEYEGIPTDSDGNYSGSLSVKTGVTAYYGVVDVTNDCIYSVLVSDGVTGKWTLAPHEYTVTALSTDSGYVDITASYKDVFAVTKRFNVAKVKAGTSGANGESTRVFFIESSAEVVRLRNDGKVSPTSISCNLYSRIGDNSNKERYTNIHAYLYYSNDGEVFDDGGLIIHYHPLGVSTLESIDIPVSRYPKAKAFRFVAKDSTDSTVLDMKTFSVIADGKDGEDLHNLQVILSNEYEGIPTDSNGAYISPLHVKTNITAYFGLNDVTGECSLRAYPSDSVIGDWTAAHEYTITGLSTDSGYVDIEVSYDTFTVTKRFSVAKTKAGANGSNGSPGKDARVFFVESSAEVVRLQSDKDKTVSPKDITFSLYSRVGNGQDRDACTNVHLYFYYSTDGETFEEWEHIEPSPEISSMSIQISSLMKSYPNAKTFRFVAKDSTNSTTLDMKTVPVIADGQPGRDGTEMTSKEVFDKLTNNGEQQGLYMGEDGNIYFNAEYIQSGTISADMISGGTISGDLINGGTIQGVQINGSTITGGTISSSMTGFYAWNPNGGDQKIDDYTTSISMGYGRITGSTDSHSGYAQDNNTNIAFDFKFNEGGRYYYALGIESDTAICLKSDKLYIYNSTNGFGTYLYDLGQTTQVQIPAMTPSGQGYVTLKFNKGILVSAI